MSLFRSTPTPTPPTLDERLASASASAGYARSVFTDAADELVEANAALVDVIADADAEVDRLTALRADALAQALTNTETISRLRALIG